MSLLDCSARQAFQTLAHLGPGAFAEIGGEVVNVVLFTMRNQRHHSMNIVDCPPGRSARRSAMAKSRSAKTNRPPRSSAPHVFVVEPLLLERSQCSRGVLGWTISFLKLLNRADRCRKYCRYVTEGLVRLTTIACFVFVGKFNGTCDRWHASVKGWRLSQVAWYNISRSDWLEDRRAECGAIPRPYPAEEFSPEVQTDRAASQWITWARRCTSGCLGVRHRGMHILEQQR